MSRTNNRTTYKYGICLNDECEKCRSKEIQQVPMRKELVCEVCGKELRECPPPKRGSAKPFVMGGVALVAIAAGIGGYFMFNGTSSHSPVPPEPIDSVVVAEDTTIVKIPPTEPVDTMVVAEDSTSQQQTNPQTPKQRAQANGTYGTVNLGYGKYTGDLKNGQPHGHGKIVYTSSHKIVSSKNFIANPGDTFEGDFREGKVSGNVGYWTHDGGEITMVKP